MIGKILMAGLVAVTIGAAALPAPAEAGGSVNFTYTPQGRDAAMIRDGLRLYSLYSTFRNHASTNQKGRNNGAAISQSGYGNLAHVFQRGSGHSATIDQSGRNNAFGVFQFGRNTSANAAQYGNGNVGFVFQGGW